MKSLQKTYVICADCGKVERTTNNPPPRRCTEHLSAFRVYQKRVPASRRHELEAEGYRLWLGESPAAGRTIGGEEIAARVTEPSPGPAGSPFPVPAGMEGYGDPREAMERLKEAQRG